MLPRYANKITEIRSIIISMLRRIREASQTTLDAYEKRDDALFNAIRQHLYSIPNDANSLDTEIVKTFALFGPEAHELRMLVAYLKMNSEIVRISDGVVKYARRMQTHCKSGVDLVPLDESIILLHRSTIHALEYMESCFEKIDDCDIDELYRKVMVEESKNDDIFAILEKDLFKLIASHEELSLEYVNVLGTLRKLERGCDRSVNIAKLMVYAEKGGDMKIYED